MKQDRIKAFFTLTGILFSSISLFAASKERRLELPRVDIEIFYVFEYLLDSPIGKQLSQSRQELEALQNSAMEASKNRHQEFVEGKTFEAQERASEQADQTKKLFFKALMDRVKQLRELVNYGRINLAEASALTLVKKKQPREAKAEFRIKEGLPGGVVSFGEEFEQPLIVSIHGGDLDSETTRREALSFQVSFFYQHGTDPFSSFKILPEAAYAPGTKVHASMAQGKEHLKQAHESMINFYKYHADVLSKLAHHTQKSREAQEPAFCMNCFELLDFLEAMKAYSERKDIQGRPNGENVALMQLAMQELIETQEITPEDIMAKMQDHIMAKMQDPGMLEELRQKETGFHFGVAGIYNTSETFEESRATEEADNAAFDEET